LFSWLSLKKSVWLSLFIYFRLSLLYSTHSILTMIAMLTFMERYSLETIETFFFFFFFFLKWKTFFSSNTIDSLFNYSNLSFIEERPPSFLLIPPMIGTVFPGPWRVDGKGIAYYQVYLFYSFWWFCHSVILLILMIINAYPF